MRQSFDDYYKSLSSVEKRILQMLSIIYEPISKNTLTKCFREYQTSNASEQTFNHTALGVILAKFQKLKLLTQEYRCHLSIVEVLTRQAIKDNHFAGLVQTVRHVLPMESWKAAYSDFRCMREIRILLYQGEYTDVKHYIDIAQEQFPDYFQEHDPYLTICNTPFDGEWLLQQSDTLKVKAIAVILKVSHLQLRPAKALLDLLKSVKQEKTVFAKRCKEFLFKHNLLTLTYKGQKALLPKKLEDHMDFISAAWWAFFHGEYKATESNLQQAGQLLKREYSKKKIYFDDITGLIYLITLLKLGGESHLNQIIQYVSMVEKRKVTKLLMSFLALKAAALIKLNKTPEAKRLLEDVVDQQRNPYDIYFVALARHWLQQPVHRHMIDRLKHVFKEAHRNHYWWLAFLCAELLTQVTDDKVYVKFFDKMLESKPFQGLLSCVEASPTWQRDLDALTTVVHEQLAQQAALDKRLAWFLDPKEKSIVPREQRRADNGEWSKGRAIALSRLYQGDDKLHYMSSQDLRICQTIEKSYDYYGSAHYYFNPVQALRELAGHGLLFFEGSDNLPLELVKSSPEVLIETIDENLSVRFSEPITDEALMLVQEAPTRFRYVEVSAEQRKIADVLGESGITVPASAKQQLLTSLGPLSSLVTVQSAIGGQQSDVKSVDADPRIYIHLLPLGEGFKLELYVKPFTKAAPYFKPGKGGSSVFATLKGKRLQTLRDLMVEEESAKRLLIDCQHLSGLSSIEDELLFASPEECLEVLSELQTLPNDTFVVEWPEGEKLKLAKTLEPKQMNMRVNTFVDWFTLDGDIALDEDKVLELRQLVQLFKQGNGKFITLGNGQFYKLSEKFRQRLAALSHYTDDTDDPLRVHRLQTPLLEDLVKGVKHFEADAGWHEQLKNLSASESLKVTVPKTLKTDLRGYQTAGFEWLTRLAYWGAGACLADDMGLGKTLQSLALLLHRAADGPALVIAPTSVCLNWQEEIERFAPSLNTKDFSVKDRHALLETLVANDIVLCSYGLLQLEGEALANVNWHTVILDEAQAIKNADTKRSKAAHGLKANFKVVTTGTPIENHLGELWNLFQFINPGLLGSQTQFSEKFANPIERHQDQNARAQLKKILTPFVLRRTKSQVLKELPPRTEKVLHVKMSEAEASFYEALRREALDKITNTDGPLEQKRMQVLAEIMRLRQACCHTSLVEEKSTIDSAKLQLFEQTIEGLLENEHKVLVFSQFVGHLSILRDALKAKGVSYQYLDGAVNVQERKKRIQAFQEGEGDVFFISLKAGGVGLNLTAADYVLHMDPWWNPAVEDQASDRAHRIGQRRPVTVYRFIVEHSIEDKILALHHQKRDLASSLLSDTHQVAKLNVDDLLGLIKSGMV